MYNTVEIQRATRRKKIENGKQKIERQKNRKTEKQKIVRHQKIQKHVNDLIKKKI